MFNEKKTEYSLKSRQDIPVIQSAKYLASRAKAIKAIQERPYLNEADFWILMNETKTGKMMYTGLIISHNACLKINDNMPEKDMYVVEDITGTHTDPYHYKLYFHTNVLPSVEVKP